MNHARNKIQKGKKQTENNRKQKLQIAKQKQKSIKQRKTRRHTKELNISSSDKSQKIIYDH